MKEVYFWGDHPIKVVFLGLYISSTYVFVFNEVLG